SLAAGGTLHMAEPFLSEIRLFSFNFPPKGWAFCNGQFLPINQNQALFSLLGTTYGGNGQTTFALPDLRGRLAMHEGAGHTLGEKGGTESVTLNIQQLPQHLHFLQGANKNGDQPIPTGNLLGNVNNLYRSAAPTNKLLPLLAGTVTNVGGSQAHTNMAPYLALNFCIALQGIFPSPN
ncbi:MAG TPA: tail fiber protein, partial [Allosphingosinicella sp.]|nr:tail fiber protein [Allosphingosinicella sp.]